MNYISLQKELYHLKHKAVSQTLRIPIKPGEIRRFIYEETRPKTAHKCGFGNCQKKIAPGQVYCSSCSASILGRNEKEEKWRERLATVCYCVREQITELTTVIIISIKLQEITGISYQSVIQGLEELGQCLKERMNIELGL